MSGENNWFELVRDSLKFHSEELSKVNTKLQKIDNQYSSLTQNITNLEKELQGLKPSVDSLERRLEENNKCLEGFSKDVEKLMKLMNDPEKGIVSEVKAVKTQVKDVIKDQIGCPARRFMKWSTVVTVVFVLCAIIGAYASLATIKTKKIEQSIENVVEQSVEKKIVEHFKLKDR